MSCEAGDSCGPALFAVAPLELLAAANHAQAAALALEGVRGRVVMALAMAPYAGLGLAGAVGDAVSLWQGVLAERLEVVLSVADGLRSTADSYLEVEDRVTDSIVSARRPRPPAA